MFASKCHHWIILPFIIAVVFYLLDFDLSPEQKLIKALFFVAVGIFFAIFFRDPERQTGKGIVAPADGKIRAITTNGQHVNISTFMNVHNVHVNRAPISGKVVRIRRVKGSFKPAFMGSAGENSRVITDLDTNIGKVRMIQIAGIFAYRIMPYIRVGQSIKKGQRIGIIRFGSRVDLILPADKIRVEVSHGQKVLAGSTTLAYIRRPGQ